jgi:4-hydroxy-3-methylbut-2-enyl diphosphate reductase
MKNIDKPMATLGPIAHNKGLVRELAARGVEVISDVGEARGRTVVIRSHGVPPEVYNALCEQGLPFIDCTCPCVRRIHEIARENHEQGRRVIIAGDASHPEVKGIKGFAGGDAVTAESYGDLTGLEPGAQYALVAQTTFNKENFEYLVSEIRANNFPRDIKIYDTVCSATSARQREAEEISQKVTVMLVIGDAGSSNTVKLLEICKKNCANTYLIESIEDLQLNIFKNDDIIGITAGASTPAAIIKEAVRKMSEVENVKDFEEMLDESLVALHTGDIVKGTVISVANGEVSVNLRYKSDGVIPRVEFSDEPNVDPAEVVKPGDEIEVYVVRVNDGEGNVLLSKKKLDQQRGRREIEEAYRNKTPLPGKVMEIIKGGFLVAISGQRVFVPSSQISNRYVGDLTQFRNKEFMFEILEYDPSKRRVVAGRKALVARELEERKERVFSSLEVGRKLQGVVSRIVDFGAFVDLGGIDGLIHISELSWSHIKRVKDVLALGDKVTVTVLDFDKERGKISLTLRDPDNNPWNRIVHKYKIGDIVEGKVVRMKSFGAFVELDEGVDGLVHISQISRDHIAKPENVLEIGQIIRVKITDIDLENNRVSLSKKEADAEDGSEFPGEYAEGGSEFPGEYAEGGSEVPGEYAEGGSEVPGEYAEDGSEVPGEYAEDGSEVPDEYAEDGSEIPDEYAEAADEPAQELEENPACDISSGVC